jgi:hypothetical protein
MDELTMASIHRLAIASISWVGAACVLLVLVVAVSGGRRRCFGSGFPATLVIATIAAVFVGNQFVIGRTGFADEWVAFDKSGVSDSLIASRMPF